MIISEGNSITLDINEQFLYKEEVEEILERLRQHVYMKPIIKEIASMERRDKGDCIEIQKPESK